MKPRAARNRKRQDKFAIWPTRNVLNFSGAIRCWQHPAHQRQGGSVAVPRPHGAVRGRLLVAAAMPASNVFPLRRSIEDLRDLIQQKWKEGEAEIAKLEAALRSRRIEVGFLLLELRARIEAGEVAISRRSIGGIGTRIIFRATRALTPRGSCKSQARRTRWWPWRSSGTRRGPGWRGCARSAPTSSRD